MLFFLYFIFIFCVTLGTSNDFQVLIFQSNGAHIISLSVMAETIKCTHTYGTDCITRTVMAKLDYCIYAIQFHCPSFWFLGAKDSYHRHSQSTCLLDSVFLIGLLLVVNCLLNLIIGFGSMLWYKYAYVRPLFMHLQNSSTKWLTAYMWVNRWAISYSGASFQLLSLHLWLQALNIVIYSFFLPCVLVKMHLIKANFPTGFYG